MQNNELCVGCKKFDRNINGQEGTCNDVFVVCDHPKAPEKPETPKGMNGPLKPKESYVHD